MTSHEVFEAVFTIVAYAGAIGGAVVTVWTLRQPRRRGSAEEVGTPIMQRFCSVKVAGFWITGGCRVALHYRSLTLRGPLLDMTVPYAAILAVDQNRSWVNIRFPANGRDVVARIALDDDAAMFASLVRRATDSGMLSVAD